MDDIVLIAKNKEALKDMMNTLKMFLREEKLTLSVEKNQSVSF